MTLWLISVALVAYGLASAISGTAGILAAAAFALLAAPVGWWLIGSRAPSGPARPSADRERLAPLPRQRRRR